MMRVTLLLCSLPVFQKDKHSIIRRTSPTSQSADIHSTHQNCQDHQKQESLRNRYSQESLRRYYN